MALVALRGMQFYAFHGFYDFERRVGSEFLLDVELTFPILEDPHDQIENTIDYEFIYRVSKKYMSKKYRLLESLAYDIAKELKSDYTKIESVKVILSKVSPPVGGKVKSAEVSIII